MQEAAFEKFGEFYGFYMTIKRIKRLIELGF